MTSLALLPIAAMAQSPIDAYTLSQNGLYGTARFMSMGGAFGALGADLSTLNQNPAGIGVYRSSDVGFTLNLDCQSATSDYNGFTTSTDQTKFLLNNIGGVGTWRMDNDILVNLNFGFTYNKRASFNKRYKGCVNSLKTSLSNYIAGIANSYELTEGDVRTSNNYDPYNPIGSRYVPWSAILGYDSYLINPEGNPEAPTWQGQFGNGTSGSGYFNIAETGGIDEYNISIGGNLANMVYWGMTFGIVSFDYNISSLWGESLTNAYVFDPNAGRVRQMDADWNMTNLYNMNGNGFNYQLGVIVKPIQELRIGLAFHTPTWFSLTENYYSDQVNYNYSFKQIPDGTSGLGYAITNDGVSTYSTTRLATPWKVIASVAGVIGSKAIISFDYEWNGYRNMSFSQPEYNDWYDYGWGGVDYNAYVPTPEDEANQMIKTIYKNTNTIRVGAEYRVLSNLSVRAGYSYSSSPVTAEAKNNLANIPTAGTLANYRLDDETHYVTCGLGFNIKGFYADAAYVWKHQNATYYPFSPDPYNIGGTAMGSNLTFNNSQIILSLGYRF